MVWTMRAKFQTYILCRCSKAGEDAAEGVRGQSAVKPFSEAVCTAVAARWVKMHSLGGIVLMPSSVPCWHPSGALIYIYSISKAYTLLS